MEEWYENPYMNIIYKLGSARREQIRNQLQKLENELRIENRFFPDSTIIRKIDNLTEASHKLINADTIIYRCRKIDKYKEEIFFEEFMNDLLLKVKEKVPDFNQNNIEYEMLKLVEYQRKNNIETFFTDEDINELYSKYSVKSWWGYGESDSDAPPQGFSSAGRINPKGISYLYASDNEKTAVLEVRPVPSQFVSVAEIEIIKDIRLFDFTVNYGFDETVKNFDRSIDLITLAEYFSQPNYSGDAAYLATQYISEYIKHLRDYNGNSIFDGICFKSSLDSSGINYVLFDISDSRKYKIKNSSVYQVLDLMGNLQRQLPIDENMLQNV